MQNPTLRIITLYHQGSFVIEIPYHPLKNITGKDFGPTNVTAGRKNLKMMV